MTTQIFTGKTASTLSSVKAGITLNDVLIANERPAKYKLHGCSIKNSVFIGLSFKEAELTDCDFSHSIFIDCYFRGAEFRGCNFTGCKFVECNFRSASFVNCSFIYSTWKETHVRREAMLANLPSWPNVAQELLIALRLNAISIGEYGDARFYLYESEVLSRSQLWNIVTCYSAYYEKKYKFLDRVKAFFQYSLSFFEKYFWGYGEQPLRLVFSGGAVVLIFAVFYCFMLKTLSAASFFTALEISLRLFTTNTPQNLDSAQISTAASWLMSIESLFGLIFIGFLAASLHRRVATRRD